MGRKDKKMTWHFWHFWHFLSFWQWLHDLQVSKCQ